MSRHSPISLILDWDGTLTTRDTLSTIASIGYTSRNSALDCYQTSPLPPWSHFVNAYISDYTVHKESYRPRPVDRRTIAEEFSWLRSLVDVERASVERVEQSGLLRGVTRDDISEGARRAVEDGSVELRPGWNRLMKRVQMNGGTVKVLSVSWSGTFIKEALRFANEKVGGEGVDIEGIEISANDYELDGDGMGTGKLTRCLKSERRGIWTGGDKAAVLKELIEKSKTSRGMGRTVYVGDSMSDLECLTQADVGICVRDEEPRSEQSGLEEALGRISMECSWIGTYKASEKKAIEKATGLWWARDFEEASASALFVEQLND